MTQWSSVPVASIQTREELVKLVDAVKGNPADAIEFDLAEVERISTLTVQTLVACTKHCAAAGKQFRLANISESATKSLALLGLDTITLTEMAA